MGKSFWDNLVHNLEKIYYTELIWLLAMIIALFIGIKNYSERNKLYPITSLCIIWYYIHYVDDNYSKFPCHSAARINQQLPNY